MKTKQLQLVTFEQAKKLKEAGFDWGVYHCYNNIGQLQRCGFTEGNYLNNPAPFVALALKWFRDEKCIHYSIGYFGNYFFRTFENHSTVYFDTYEAAESALLDELLKTITKSLA